jgi:hypothetical protein
MAATGGSGAPITNAAINGLVPQISSANMAKRTPPLASPKGQKSNPSLRRGTTIW